VNRSLLNEIAATASRGESLERFKGKSTLTLIQSIATIPSAFPTSMNTCGRICVHKSGHFVIVSNRGHESIAIFRVKTKGNGGLGKLKAVGYHHTRGETPRHFQFDSSGQFLIVANQDSDSVAVFTFNLSSGEIKYTGNEYRVPSPNFVCCCPDRDDDITSLTAPPFSIKEHSSNTTPSQLTGNSSDLDNESDLESEESTIPTAVDAKILQRELVKARRELEELREKLASMEKKNE